MNTSQNPLSRGDSASIIAFIITGAAIGIATIVQVILRIIELVRGVDVMVAVEFLGQPVTLTEGGSTVQVALDRGEITAGSLDGVAIVTGIIGQVAFLLTILMIVGALVLLSRNILRGRVFSRGNTRLVVTAGIVGLVGFAATSFFNNMLANAAIAAIAPNITNAVISVQPLPWILSAFVVATVATAFSVGDRLQRETAGLV